MRSHTRQCAAGPPAPNTTPAGSSRVAHGEAWAERGGSHMLSYQCLDPAEWSAEPSCYLGLTCAPGPLGDHKRLASQMSRDAAPPGAPLAHSKGWVQAHQVPQHGPHQSLNHIRLAPLPWLQPQHTGTPLQEGWGQRGGEIQGNMWGGEVCPAAALRPGWSLPSCRSRHDSRAPCVHTMW